MTTLTIEFTDGTKEEIRAYRVTYSDHVLRARTSHETSYRDDWKSWPLVNVKSWKTS